MNKMDHPTRGLTVLAIMYSLPYALLMWGCDDFLQATISKTLTGSENLQDCLLPECLFPHVLGTHQHCHTVRRRCRYSFSLVSCGLVCPNRMGRRGVVLAELGQEVLEVE